MSRWVLIHCAVVVCLVGQAAPAGAREPDERVAIRATALDYIDGWYEGDGARMARALHPELAKRILRVGPGPDDAALDQMGATTLVRLTAMGRGAATPKEKRQNDVLILDVFNDMASVRVTAGEWIDYLHLARWKGRWVIVNVLWQMKPEHR